MQLPTLPLLTADLPGVGGQLKTVPEDFEVEEIPAYQPAGHGRHLFLWVQKRGLGADYFLRQVAQRLGLSLTEVGCAGLKDRHAITRQWLSVPEFAEPRLHQLDGEGIELLRVTRHPNKLRTGHLRGNRFRVLLRGVSAEKHQLALAILARIGQHGLPNFYGAQRFGHDSQTVACGLALLRGEPIPTGSSGRSLMPNTPQMRRLALSAVQSLAFNDYLTQRLGDGLLQRVLPGDVMSKWPSGGLFCAEHLAIEQARFDARETVTTGPIFGRKTFSAKDEAAQREDAIRRRYGLMPASLARFGKLMEGTRRHNLVYIEDLAIHPEPEGLRLSFSLPAGSFATVLLREIMKSTETSQFAEDTANDSNST